MIGRTIAHYRIEDKLGEGGMGEVYRARDLRLDRAVAIKFIASRLAGETERRRFETEARSASALNHPNILTVHEVGAVDDQPYLVTEFIDGGTLRDWARREKPSVRQIVDLIIGIADALATAHQAGILHRDVKPENILVSKQSYAKLVDFGLAKLLGPEGELQAEETIAARTRAGIIVGTVAYMSPEQATGRPVDARTDVFAFGVVLYELVGGRRPFDHPSDVETIHAVLHQAPPPLSGLRTDLPYELRLIVEKALEKDPADRYQTMRDLVVDLRRVQRLGPSRSADVALASARRGPSRLLLACLASAAIVLAAIAATAWVYRGDFFWRNPLAAAQFTRLTDFEGAELDGAISPDGKFVAFLSDRDGQFDAWVGQIGSGTWVNLTRGKRAPTLSPVVRSIGFSGEGTHVWMWSGGIDPLGRIVPGTSTVPIMGGVAPQPFVNTAINVAWSPDQKQIVYHESTTGDPMLVADPDGNNPKQIFVDKDGNHNHYPIWSLDGRFIYFVRGYAPDEMDIWRIPSTGGEPDRLTHHNAHVAYLAMLDRGRLLYTAPAEDGSGPWLYELDAERRVSHRVSSGLEQYLSIDASADGRHLVASVANPTANLWTAAITDHVVPESEVAKLSLPTPRALAPHFGSDYLLYLSSKGGGNGLWKFKDGAVAELWRGTSGPVVGGAITSPDGRRIAFAVRKEGHIRLHVMDADGTGVRALAPALEVRGTLSWSPDGKWIAMAEGRSSRLFKVPVDGGSPVPVTDGLALNPVWSPDGSLIVYSVPDLGASFPIRAVTPDGAARPLPELFALNGGDRYRFLPDGRGLVVMQGAWRQQDFWLLDLATNKLRRLTELKGGYATTAFDVSRDGRQILFDRARENSDIVLITLPPGS